MRFSLSAVILAVFFTSCGPIGVSGPEQRPIPVEQVLISDVRGVLSESLDKLLIDSVMQKPDDSMPFVMVEHFGCSVLPDLDSGLLAQDIRLKLLMSDKVVTLPEPEKGDSEGGDKERRRVLDQCDFIFSSGLFKEPFVSPNQDVQHVLVLRSKLTDARTNLVIWESSAKLLK
ncbi:MAG: hypothetical protein JW808_06500 [Victivallales bacterium]|nr:hypothetical protein [Victivallales bacterium]